jgi:sarcosine oxidase
MNNNYDVIVSGVGSMGSAACYFLAKSGINVLGIEQFGISHDWGSHGGQSRIIRKAYFEHPDYVPLLQRAYENWTELEQLSGMPVFLRTGLLYAGIPGEPVIEGVKKSAGLFNIPVQQCTHHELEKKFPAFCIPDGYEILFEPDAGFLTPERAILLYTEQAIRLGADIHTHEKVLSWNKQNGLITVETDQGTYSASKLIVTAGPWASGLMPPLSPQLQVSRQIIAWMNVTDKTRVEYGHFPCWLIAEGGKSGAYYGFPYLHPGEFGGPIGLKIALHYPGDTTDPDKIGRLVNPSESDDLVRFMNHFLPGTYHSTHILKTCMYTNTPDEHFIIDFLPGQNNDVVLAAGFSGHGFKFASAVGEILADLALKGTTPLPIGFLSAGRFKSAALS